MSVVLLMSKSYNLWLDTLLDDPKGLGDFYLYCLGMITACLGLFFLHKYTSYHQLLPLTEGFHQGTLRFGRLAGVSYKS